MKMMKRMLIVWGVVLCAVLPAAAQKPLYIVNGEPREEIASIPPEDIESVVKKAFATKGVKVVDCIIDKDEFVLPMIPPGKNFDAILTAKPVIDKGGRK